MTYIQFLYLIYLVFIVFSGYYKTGYFWLLQNYPFYKGYSNTVMN